MPRETGLIINGEKWFSTNADAHASFFIVMAVTSWEARTYEMSHHHPADTSGIEIVRNVGVGAGSTGTPATAIRCITTSALPIMCRAARAKCLWRSRRSDCGHAM